MRHVTHKALLIFAALGVCWNAPARAETPGPVTIPLSPYLGVIWSFQATVKDKPETFLLDTAGGVTVITPQTAAELGCEPWGQITGFRMRGDRVDMQRCDHAGFAVGDARLVAPTAGVWDFSHILPKNAPPLAGSIALDSFAGQVITLDLAHRQLVIETPQSLKQRIAGATAVEMRISRDAQGLALTPLLAVETKKGKIWMELDSGSDASVMVAQSNAALLGMDPDVKSPQPLHATLAGGVRLDTDSAAEMPLILDGNIGAPTLAKWVVTLDLASGRAWISPAAK